MTSNCRVSLGAIIDKHQTLVVAGCVGQHDVVPVTQQVQHVKQITKVATAFLKGGDIEPIQDLGN